MISFTLRGIGTASLTALMLASCAGGRQHPPSGPHPPEPGRSSVAHAASPHLRGRLLIVGRVTAKLPGQPGTPLRARGVPGVTVSLLAGEPQAAGTFTGAQGRFAFRLPRQQTTVVILLPLQQVALSGSLGTSLTAGPPGTPDRCRGQQLGDIIRLDLTTRCEG